MKASTLVHALVWVSFASAFTQLAPAASNDVQVTVENVSDMRSSGNGSPRCTVQLRFSGGDVSEAYNIRGVRVITAVDDTGHDLRVETESDRNRIRYSQGYWGPQGNNFAQQSMHPVELLSPPRESHFIKFLAGEADLFFPTTENGGLVIVKNVLSRPGETFTDPALKKLNVNITYLGKEGDDSETSTQRVQSTSSTTTNPSPSIRRLPFRRTNQNQMKGLQFSIDDPDRRIVDLSFMDAYCRQAWGGMNYMNGNIRTYQFQNEAPSTLRLYIYLAAPEAIKTVPFQIQNIELP
jgi:hypothetical protein